RRRFPAAPATGLASAAAAALRLDLREADVQLLERPQDEAGQMCEVVLPRHELEALNAVEEDVPGHVLLEARQPRTRTHVLALAERHMPRCVRTIEVELVGVRELLFVAVRGREAEMQN